MPNDGNLDAWERLWKQAKAQIKAEQSAPAAEKP